MGTIEFHGWDSHVEALEKPDRMVFDLDPDEGLDFADVKKAAVDIRRQLADIGLVSFAMLSGGKGVHIVVPLDPGHGWDAHKDFSQRFAEADRKSVVEGKSVSVRVVLGGRRIIKKKKNNNEHKI